jgi:hypothetical protein
MAKLSFIKGAITGRLGEFVGSKWKGINYIRTYGKPSNPRTEGQVSVRKIFKALSDFANALYAADLLYLIPPAPQMTERNSVFKANASMFENKTFAPTSMQVAKPNISALVLQLGCVYRDDEFRIQGNAIIPQNVKNAVANFLVYDIVKGIAINSFSMDVNTGTVGLSTTFDAIPEFNSELTSLKTSCRLYAFISAVDADDNPLISATYSSAVV